MMIRRNRQFLFAAFTLACVCGCQGEQDLRTPEQRLLDDIVAMRGVINRDAKERPTSVALVTVLDLNRCWDVDDAFLERLRVFTNLEELYLNSTSVSDQGLVHLRFFPKLDMLTLNRTRVRGEGFKHLTALPALRQLYLGDLPLYEADFKPLAQMGSLHFLWLDGSQVNPENLRTLRERRPHLEIAD